METGEVSEFRIDESGVTSNTTNKGSDKNRTMISDQDKREPKQEENREQKLKNDSGA